MQNKLIVNKSITLSGENLFLGLGLGLSSFALILDSMANRNIGIESLSLPLILCGLATASLGYWVIPILRRLKAGQIIREDGPQAHLQKRVLQLWEVYFCTGRSSDRSVILEISSRCHGSICNDSSLWFYWLAG